jgi:hypothetical protein
MNGSKELFLWIAIVTLLLLFTGGVAIQDVQRFDPVAHEGVRVSLVGSVSQFSIPFLLSTYSEKGPFHVRVAYHNTGEKRVREVHLRCVNVSWESQSVRLVVDGPIALPVRTRQYPNSTSGGIL